MAKTSANEEASAHARVAETKAELHKEIRHDMRMFLLASKPGGLVTTPGFDGLFSSWALQSEWARGTGGERDASGAPLRVTSASEWEQLFSEASETVELAGLPFRCLAPAALTRTLAVQPGASAVSVLKTGDIVEILEVGYHDGRRRLRTAGGWVSEVAIDGRTLLQSAGDCCDVACQASSDVGAVPPDRTASGGVRPGALSLVRSVIDALGAAVDLLYLRGGFVISSRGVVDNPTLEPITSLLESGLAAANQLLSGAYIEESADHDAIAAAFELDLRRLRSGLSSEQAEPPRSPRSLRNPPSEKDAKLAQKLGQLQPFIAVFPQ